MTTKILPLILFILSLLLLPQSFANTPNKVDLSLTPLACFVKKIGDFCNITVKVNWRSENPITACLYQDTEKMQCWLASRTASTKIDVSLNNNMVYSLRGNNNEVYAQQHVAIAASSSKKYRRRLRADWSFF